MSYTAGISDDKPFHLDGKRWFASRSGRFMVRSHEENNDGTGLITHSSEELLGCQIGKE